jgi:hypothetical protein
MAARLAWSSWQEGGDAASSFLRWRGESMDTFHPRISQGDMFQRMHFFLLGPSPIVPKTIESPVGLLDSRLWLRLGQILYLAKKTYFS